ncbi:MAG: hypothetical protein K6A77_07650 [Clostridiales bacterium]|nr:hypothetical protein [Clostridiales bacterium]
MLRKLFLFIIAILLLLSVLSDRRYPDHIKLAGNYSRLQREVSQQLRGILFPELRQHGVNVDNYKIRLFSASENSDIEGYQLDGFVLVRDCRGRFSFYRHEGRRKLNSYEERNSCKVHTETETSEEGEVTRIIMVGIIQKGKYEYELQSSFTLEGDDREKVKEVTAVMENMYNRILDEIAYTERA